MDLATSDVMKTIPGNNAVKLRPMKTPCPEVSSKSVAGQLASKISTHERRTFGTCGSSLFVRTSDQSHLQCY